LHALIGELGLRERVHLLGDVADTVALYEAIDLFALSSLREGLPNALLEAMAMRVPVVAAAVGGVPAVVRDGENGLLYPAGDVGALIATLWRGLADAPLRDRLGGAARRTVEAGFTFAGRMAAERAVYDRLRSGVH
jgi:glycosyltransferase involved in cell wall biosynthesis